MFTKSSVTNLIALLLTGIGYFSPYYPELIWSIGSFALSGAITNWLAIHMLFEKVPGFYGSGVIPSRFSEFKAGINTMIMDEFFSVENIHNFFKSSANKESNAIDFSNIINGIDYSYIFKKLMQAITESPLGGMLAMVGGEKALEPVRDPFINKMKEALQEISQGEGFQAEVKTSASQVLDPESLKIRVQAIVQQRLDELTPQMVKEIIQKMIREHLGWLVVWGGVFGGLIGLIVYLIN